MQANCGAGVHARIGHTPVSSALAGIMPMPMMGSPAASPAFQIPCGPFPLFQVAKRLTADWPASFTKLKGSLVDAQVQGCC